LGVRVSGSVDGYEDKYYYGRRPNGIYIPRFRNVNGDKRDYLRGFGYQGSGSRGGWSRDVAELEIGLNLKETLTEPGGWTMGMMGFGEILPYHENKVTLDKTKKDKWGLNVLAIDCELKENELKMRKDMLADGLEMLEAAGVKNVTGSDGDGTPGRGIHEMGTARMGTDPKNSVLNKWNQIWDAPNVFVTDGASMTSGSCVNPSLTYMALTARAADYAVSELKKGNL
jgi:choline dehydrogenase-like flavoprotein